jgi:hypothetical protein
MQCDTSGGELLVVFEIIGHILYAMRRGLDDG